MNNLLHRQYKDLPDTIKLSESDLARILAKCNGDPVQNMDCVNWIGYTNSSIKFSFKGKKVSLIRLLYQNFHGVLKESEEVNHKCSNSKCININHLTKSSRNNYLGLEISFE